MSELPPLAPKKFQKKILDWYQQAGRKNLPWQKNITPYRVWVSEIMLQQTQVATVIGYYRRFMQHFPTLKSLALADEEEVLHLWSGLGYYSRARNLKKTAEIIWQQYHGRFPRQLETLCQLPGIGRSTAGAIASIALQQPAPILDGNVKRVLCRFAAINGWPESSATQKKLWQLASNYMPLTHTREYTQAMMDLGALVCTRQQPLCSCCPLQAHCLAHQHQQTDRYPEKKPRKKIPEKQHLTALIFNSTHHVLLEKRPTQGIWAGLWVFPETPLIGMDEAPRWLAQAYGLQCEIISPLPPFSHTFSHFKLHLQPLKLRLQQILTPLDASRYFWYKLGTPLTRGTAKPIKTLLQNLEENETCHE